MHIRNINATNSYRLLVLRTPVFYSSLTVIISLFLLNCDSTTSPQSVITERPGIQSIRALPSIVQFSLQNDGYKDTTITVILNVDVSLNGSDELPVFVITNLSDREVILSGTMNSVGGIMYQIEFDITTSTTQFANFSAQVFSFDEFGNSNSAEQNIEFRGFSNARPQILEANNVDEINRPANGEITTQFTAKVTDADGQGTIDQVLVRILDILGAEVPNSPFEMFDDGIRYEDVAANDSVYSITFPIAAVSGREAQSFFIEYFAIDQGGIYSDTTRTIFKITNNQ